MFYSPGKTHSGHTHRPLARADDRERVRCVPTHEEIAALAYSYWEGRERRHGSAQEDWLRAERELSERQGA
jgi:hypothetical protein